MVFGADKGISSPTSAFSQRGLNLPFRDSTSRSAERFVLVREPRVIVFFATGWERNRQNMSSLPSPSGTIIDDRCKSCKSMVQNIRSSLGSQLWNRCECRYRSADTFNHSMRQIQSTERLLSEQQSIYELVDTGLQRLLNRLRICGRKRVITVGEHELPARHQSIFPCRETANER